MRIVHLSDYYLPRLGGVEMHVHDLAVRQAEQGHDVSILTSSPSGGVSEDPRVRVVRLTDHVRHPRALHPRAPFAGARALDRADADVVHVHVGLVTPLAFWGARAAVRRGIPTVVTNHSLWSGYEELIRALDAAGGWSRGGIVWSTVSEAAATPMRAVLPPRCEVRVISNGIDEAFWELEPEPRPDDGVLLLAVMRLSRRKRPLPLLRMLDQLRQQLPADDRLSVVIVGEGPQRPMMQRYLRRHGMEQWVHLAGRLDRAGIRELCRRADAFLAPADLESFGIAALEARCAGVPVIAKSGTGITEFVQHGEHGLIADSDAEMVEALHRLCADPALRASLRGPGGTEHTGWAEVLAATQRLYDEAALLPRQLVGP